MQVYIFGAGKYGRKLLEYLEVLKTIEVVAFIDNNSERQGDKIEGRECISVEELVRRGGEKETILVSPYRSDDIMKQLQERNCDRVIYLGGWLRAQEQELKRRELERPIILEETDFKNARPFNYYDSPYPDIVEVHKKEKEIFDQDKVVLDIDFNVDRQLELINTMENIPLPEWGGGRNEKGNIYRYYYDNTYFEKGSADILYYIMRILKPKNIIEVGSGFSTAVMLDTNEHYFNNEINIISIEPYTDRLRTLIRSDDKIKIYEKDLQKISLDLFEMLEENDILFIDSSHVSKIDSDVNYLFFEILPRLKKGVYIHFHDVFYPFIYCKEWIYEGRAYNEMYLLRAFLMNNNAYSVQFFGEMMEYCFKEKLCDKLAGNCSGSIWIRKDHAI